jgi:glycosyltransferase involved in cell wall biosynthesis
MTDNGDPTIWFDKNGFCNYCTEALKSQPQVYFPNEEGEKRLRLMIEKMKVFLKLTPEEIEKASRDIRELKAVKKLGYDVFVIAGRAWEKGLPQVETNETYSLQRVGMPLKKRSRFLFIRFFRLMKRFRYWRKEAVKFGLKICPDVVSARDLLGLQAGCKLKQKIEKKYKKPCKLVYDSHELTTEINGLKQKPRWDRKFIERNERKYIKKADAAMMVCDSIAEHNLKKYRLEKKPYVVRNIPDSKPVRGKYNHFREKWGIGEDKIILLYQGGFMKGRGIENIIKTLRVLDDRFVFVMLGYPEEEYINVYKKIAEQIGVAGRVYYMPAVPQSVLGEYSGSADIGLHLIENTCLNHFYCLPNKIFEYINAGLPVLCSDFPEMKKIVSGYRVGETVEYDNVEKIAEAVKAMAGRLDSYKENFGRAQSELNWEKEEQVLLNMYRELSKGVKI